jgi:glycosyltransferase involved in cell wall biosynthesis
VSEAHINGIPVIASNVEGLVDSVGPGGVLVDPKESTQAWNEALSAVWDDEQAYNELCRRALLYSERPDLSVPNVLERFEFVIARAIERHHDQDPPRVDV